jgi:hypothetical protein
MDKQQELILIYIQVYSRIKGDNELWKEFITCSSVTSDDNLV